MIKKTFLCSVFFLLIIVFTACGPAAAPEGSTSVPVDLSGIVPFIIFAIIVGAIVVIGKIYGFVKTKKGAQDSPATIKKNNRFNPPADNQSKTRSKPKTAAPSNKAQKPVSKTPASSHIFISYRRSDSADIAGRIYDRLTGKFGRNPIFKDVDSIPLGLDFKEYLDIKVSECSVLLAIIGDRWLETDDATGKKRLDDPTDFVRIEIESALKRGIPVIPLLVRGAQMPSEKNLPDSLKKLVYRNGIPIRPDPDFHRDMDRLITALEKIINPDK